MGTFKNKKIIKNLIIIIAVTTLLSALVPLPTMAKTDTENGGKILTPIEDFVLFVCDKIMGWLQNTFTSSDGIEVRDNVWEFKYSPAIIFSGTVPALDINFMNPDSTVSTGSSAETYIKNSVQEYYGHRNKNYKSQYESAKNNGNTSFTKGGMTKQGVSFSYSVYYWIENDTLNIACMFDSGWKLIRRTI